MIFVVAMLLIVFAYLLGATPFALLVSRLLRLPDPRSYGSGNIGATNVARGGNKLAAILTLFADGGKGAVAVAAAKFAESPDIVVAGAGVAAVVGHVFPVFLRFRGGRGVAAAFGVFLSWQPLVGLAALAVWALTFAVGRYSSVASIFTVGVAAALFATLSPPPFAVGAVGVAILVVGKHKDNIRRLRQGAEPRFSSAKNKHSTGG